MPRRKKKTSSTAKDKSPRAALLKLARAGLIAGLWCGIASALIIGWYASELPAIVRSPDFERKHAVTIRAYDGGTVARYGELKGAALSVSELPPQLIYAVLAIEDRRFYKHFGIDLIGLARATVNNLKAGSVVEGGSTITQQLAKNLFLTPERKFKRKIQEAMLALWLEHELSKDEILTAYLNRVYLGSGAYGVEAASHIYFNKSARTLNLREAATLAGLLKAPSRYSPENNPALSAQRTAVVLSAMFDAGFISKQEAEAGEADLEKLPPPAEKGQTIRYYTDWVVSDLKSLTGELPEDMVVDTVMIPPIQEAAEKSVARVLDKFGEERHASQAAVVVMDTDGAVLAMVGGYDYGVNQFNRAADALRPPGSSFKPIVYLTALEQGMKPDDLVEDSPIAVGRYRPENFKREYFGEVPLEFALARSLNSVAVKLAQQAGVQNVINMARQLGIRSKLQPDLSISLGSSGVPVIEMATAYASIARGGYVVVPYAISSIKDDKGRLVYQRMPVASDRQVVSSRAISDLIYMMEGVIAYGTGQGAELGVRAAGKTGTSQDFRDAWFIGFAGNIVCAVWVGNDDNSPMKNVTGGSLPVMIWKDVMTTALAYAQKEKGLAPLPPSSSVLEDRMDSLIGRILGAPAASLRD